MSKEEKFTILDKRFKIKSADGVYSVYLNVGRFGAFAEVPLDIAKEASRILRSKLTAKLMYLDLLDSRLKFIEDYSNETGTSNEPTG